MSKQTSNNNRIQHFEEKWSKLPQTNQEVLMIMSMAYEPLSQTLLLKLLGNLFIRNTLGVSMTSKDVKLVIQDLETGLWLEYSGKNGWKCRNEYSELILQKAYTHHIFREAIELIRHELPYKNYSGNWYPPRNFDVAIRELRFAVYNRETFKYKTILDEIRQHFRTYLATFSISKNLFDNPFDPDWFASLDPGIQCEIVNSIVMDRSLNLEPLNDIIDYLKGSELYNHVQAGSAFRQMTLFILLLHGDTEGILLLLKKYNEYNTTLPQAILGTISGNYKVSADLFEIALKTFRNAQGNKKTVWDAPIGIFYFLSLIANETTRDWNKIQTILQYVPSQHLAFSYFSGLTFYFNNKITDAYKYYYKAPLDAFGLLIYGISCYWTEYPLSSDHIRRFKDYAHLAEKNGYWWFALEFNAILSHLAKSDDEKKIYHNKTIALEQKTGLKNISGVIRKTEAWERSLEALLRVSSSATGSNTRNKTIAETRMVWFVNFDKGLLQPAEQSIGKDGTWSKGRNIALKRLKEGGVTAATKQDQQLATCVRQVNYGYYGGTQYEVDFDKALPLLVGHPLLFLLDSPGIACELIEKTPELLVEEKKDGFEIKLSHDFKDVGIHLERETNTRYHLINVRPEHINIVNALGKRALRVPAAAKDTLIKAVQNLAGIITIHSEVGQDNKDIPEVQADASIHAHMLPLGDGFKLELFVKPFKDYPPYLKPGSGRENVLAEINKQKMRAQRNLEQERINYEKVIAACPILSEVESYDGQWVFDDTEACLQALLEVGPLRESKELTLEWPKGEKFRVTQRVDWNQFGLKINKQSDWFSVEGELKLSENLVLTMEQLLNLVQKSTNSSFIEISDGHFVALTKQFQKKLKEMEAFLQQNKKGGFQFNPLASSVMEGLLDGLQYFQSDKHWKEYSKKLQEAKKIDPPVPSTFQAELRSYQADGYKWLAQLAHWGVGACLADDMGLGKTIQALAILLLRAEQGPALVVAPSSVSINWLKEVAKFAPTLNAISFGKGDRKQTFDDLKPYDLLICSYGLMQQEAEMFSKQKFSTIILDEAQAIKNYGAKRTQAAMDLQGDFKIITTGTPIENHLGELWSLFNFINPGLLGTQNHFQDRFAIPIEKLGDKERKNQLKKLIQPFVLRRRKNDVLDELPSKTEITLTVQLSDEERAFYEALRRNALKNLESDTKNEGGGQQRIRILAEIMRLRQACCNPKLVDSNLDISSAKLSLFGDIVDELLENGHKALVFSQFVGHLRIIEDYIKKKNIKYQYLDGQTPMKKREEMITGFQRGDGDLFLISLKAGGVGLNLTAADYVIHMDPWWNPAVEDQASDRAHRIGQLRPVTIYRLITEQTIEEKIVNLHATKRDLADSLLEGTDSSVHLSAEDLMNLLREGI